MVLNVRLGELEARILRRLRANGGRASDIVRAAILKYAETEKATRLNPRSSVVREVCSRFAEPSTGAALPKLDDRAAVRAFIEKQLRTARDARVKRTAPRGRSKR